MADKRPALGRGLSALIPDAPAPPPAAASDRPFEVDTDRLRPNRFQPRSTVDEAGIEDLARSLKSAGMIQPIVVRRADEGYEIVAGERRWRAAQRAGLHKVPVVVRDVPDHRLLEAALIENVQREDLNPLEEAQAYRRLTDEFHLTQDQIAGAVGKDRSSVANYLRLLKLPQEVRGDIGSGALSMGHARALLALADQAAQLRLAREVVARSLSVRQTEALVRKAGQPPVRREESPKDVHTRAAEEKLRFALGTRVEIVRKGTGGRVQIDFQSEDELQRIFEYLTER